MPTLFTRIIQGEIPCHQVAEDDRHIAFLDIRPVKPGHTLVVPKREVDYIFDLTDEETAALWCFARRVAVGVKAATRPTKVGIMVAGLEVPHVHIHLIPITSVGDLNFKLATDTPADELAAMATRIREGMGLR